MEAPEQKLLTEKEPALGTENFAGDGCDQHAAPPMVTAPGGQGGPSASDGSSKPVMFYDSATGTEIRSRFPRGYVLKPFYSFQTDSGEDMRRTDNRNAKYFLLVCCTPYVGMIEELRAYFGWCPSFIRAEMKKGKDGIALAEFDDEEDCLLAMECFHGLEVRPQNTLKIYRIK